MTSKNSTICAIATASGVASIAIVRLSGDKAVAIAQKICKKDTFTPRYAHLHTLYDYNDNAIDQAIVIYFQAPFSFSGEDIVEFQCHGGMVVAQAVLQATRDYGATLAAPGEFSKRAFLNGKIDLTKAEAIAKLIESKSQDAAKILTRQLKGELKTFIDDAREKLLSALAYSEVSIDYAEEELPADLLHNLERQLEQLIQTIEKIVASSNRRKGLIEGFKISIIGKPNVGKSSLLNAMLSFNRAIVSDIAGTTRDTIEEHLQVGTHLVKVVDTAGIRDSKETIEKIGIEKSLQAIEQSDIVIALFDGSREFENEDAHILKLLQQTDIHKIVAINKSDLPAQLKRSKLQAFDPLFISTKNSFEPLIDALQQHLDDIGLDEEIMLTSNRQIDAVQKAKEQINAALPPLQSQELELFSYHLLEAVTHLSSISKPYNSEEILDKMFSEFCLGK
ncbi:MAG: tRNA uridine-5-carboxymethylaminomethyl(34) synthesis GTPase MnmE [Campylobacterota bacterium]